MPSKKKNAQFKRKGGGKKARKISHTTGSSREAMKLILVSDSMKIVGQKLGISQGDFKNKQRVELGAVSHFTFDCPVSDSMLDFHLMHEPSGMGVAIYTTPLDSRTHVGFMVMPMSQLLNMRNLQNSLAHSFGLEVDGELVETLRSTR